MLLKSVLYLLRVLGACGFGNQRGLANCSRNLGSMSRVWDLAVLLLPCCCNVVMGKFVGAYYVRVLPRVASQAKVHPSGCGSFKREGAFHGLKNGKIPDATMQR